MMNKSYEELSEKENEIAKLVFRVSIALDPAKVEKINISDPYTSSSVSCLIDSGMVPAIVALINTSPDWAEYLRVCNKVPL